MQKQVSKHGLAVLALSILLVLSLGLTATFAVFNTSGTTSGTVTFNDTIEITGMTSKTMNVTIPLDGTGTVTYTTGGDQIGNVTINAGGATFFWKATLEITAGSGYFTFDTSNMPQLNSTNAANTSTGTLITWAGASGVTAQQTLDVSTMLAALKVVPDYSAIGGADDTPAGSLTLTIMAQYNAF